MSEVNLVCSLLVFACCSVSVADRTAGVGMELRLKREIGVIGAISYVAGGIIGGGIFVSPSSVLAGAGSSLGLSLCIWTLCGIISYCGALSYAELGTRVKTSGGSYTYVRAAFGDLAGFCVLWTQLIVVRPLAAVLGSMVAAEYIIRSIYIDCPDMAPRTAKVLLGTVVLGFFVASNCLSVRLSASLQTVSAVCKVGALIVIIGAGVVHLAQGHTGNFQEPFQAADVGPGGLAIAFYAGFYAYIGWDHINNAVEEIQDQQRTMPVAILVGLAIPTACYILANIAYHAVMTNQEILSGIAVAVVFGERMLGDFKYVLMLCISISAAGIANVIIFTSSRLNFVGGRDKIFPSFLGMVNTERRTPMPTILLIFVFAMIIISIGDVKTIIGMYSFFRALPEALAILGIWRIRKKYVDTERTYKVHTLFPAIFVLFFGILSITAIVSEPGRFVVPLTMALAGIPVYIVSNTEWWIAGPGLTFNAKMVAFCQRLLLCDLSEITNEHN